MVSIRRIQISGFRGILNPLTIDFVNGNKCQSAIIYGANGTGKSSITDAWEWLTTGKIQHLAREGAEEGAYPHMAAKPGASFVEVEFTASEIWAVKLEFDDQRVTKPKTIGNLDDARRLIAHSCHIRYSDLTNFVFLRKAARYDALASLMGFVPQMEYQKALRRVQTNFGNEVIQYQSVKDYAETRFKEFFKLSEVQVDMALEQLAQICESHRVASDRTLNGLKLSNKKLQSDLASDPTAKKLAEYQALEVAIRASETPPNLLNQIISLRDAIGRVKAEQKEQLATQLLIPVFQAADEYLSRIRHSGHCPLCGKAFDGDMDKHVKNELAKMKHLRKLLDNLKNCREKISESLSGQVALVQTFDRMAGAIIYDEYEDLLSCFRTAATNFDISISRLRSLLSFDSTSLTDELISSFMDAETSLKILQVTIKDAKDTLLNIIDNQKIELERNPTRQKLVSDAAFINSGIALIDEVESKTTQLERARIVSAGYSDVVNNYVSTCLEDVQRRFDEISDNVKIYFEILEKDTKGLGAPKLKLLSDQDRSVVLEISFHGEIVQPAYKYLSESQLNSFGLAVFLASATHFNKDCQFLILDDVVNSFDTYKRPLLIDLIKQHLQDCQILLLTHDRFFRELLYKNLPSWKKIDFTDYTFGVGPSVYPGMHTLEKVREALKRDEPDQASRTLFNYVEDVLQEINERFECEVKFSRRNEYTLDTLLVRFRVRVSANLNSDHSLTKAVIDFYNLSAYRNWTTHCKNPISPIHKNEVEEVLRKWELIESIVTCQEEKCFKILKYERNGVFSCPCGKTQLTKQI